jgi:dihydrofolate reductase
MLIHSMSVSVDGFIADREGAFGWTAPDEELFRFHLAEVRELGGYLIGRRLYETMLVWETNPSLRDNELGASFADVWCAIPKTVFSRTLDSVQGNARLAEASVAEEVAASLEATDKDVEIGGAGLAAAAIELGLVDELRMFRYPIVAGGGTPYLPRTLARPGLVVCRRGRESECPGRSRGGRVRRGGGRGPAGAGDRDQGPRWQQGQGRSWVLDRGYAELLRTPLSRSSHSGHSPKFATCKQCPSNNKDSPFE